MFPLFCFLLEIGSCELAENIRSFFTFHLLASRLLLASISKINLRALWLQHFRRTSHYSWALFSNLGILQRETGSYGNYNSWSADNGSPNPISDRTHFLCSFFLNAKDQWLDTATNIICMSILFILFMLICIVQFIAKNNVTMYCSFIKFFFRS